MVTGIGVFSESNDSIAGANNWTTSGTLAASNNKLYIAFVLSKTVSGWSPAPTLSGAGINWVHIATATNGVQSNVAAFRGLVTSGASTGALTFDTDTGDDIYYPRIQVIEFSDVDTSGTDGSGAVLQSVQVNGTGTSGTVSITMTTGDALVAGWHNNTNGDITPRASWTEAYDSATGNGTGATQFYIGTDTAVSATWSSSGDYSGIGIEIKGNSNTIGDDLVAAWDFTKDSDQLVDFVDSITLALNGGAALSGGGVLCDADGEKANVVTPVSLRLALPLTIACDFDLLGATGTYATFFGAAYDIPFGAPYLGYAVSAYPDSSPSFKVEGNSSGVYDQYQTGIVLGTGRRRFMAVFTSTGRKLYIDGTLVADNTTTAYTNPTYDTESEFGIGDLIGNGNSNSQYYRLFVWSSDKSSDAAAWAADTDDDWLYLLYPPASSSSFDISLRSPTGFNIFLEDNSTPPPVSYRRRVIFIN